MTLPVLAQDSRIVAREPFSADLGGEVVVLSLRTGAYYGLTGVAARVWELAQKGATLDEIEHAVVSEYQVDRARCRSDLQAFLGALHARGLIEIDAPPDAGSP